ncbi:phosphodiester glycosidase family protein [Streptomyces albofaciens]|uniref:phosphodiester glycosidase family protein n=1 Tax=Streptomyces albofaciens TaxID=66866 RepID=UPI00142ECDB4|nr:phosphodiester glycosidase family protein [Streptomyces albofaciens]
MKNRFVRARAVLTALTAWGVLAGSGVAAGATATHGGAPRLGPAVGVAPGVTYRAFDVAVGRGTAHGHLVEVDLTDRRVRVDLLYPGAVGARSPVSRLADARAAVAAVNADFFNISEAQHPGVEATGAPVGPAIAAGRHLKAAVPDGQRFGPALPPGTDTRDVIGVGYDRRARLDRLSLRGSALTADGALPLKGLNQYALPVNGIGAFTDKWGTTSRVRATCGTDTDRAAPCSTETYEVTVRRGRVAGVAQIPGRGGIARGTTALVGREEGARQLRKLHVGDPVRISHRLTARRPVPLRFAVGGFPIVRDAEPLAGLDTVTPAVRTSAGVGAHGRRLLLLALDGAPGRAGMTVRELADLMDRLGARDAVNLDGGGSSTLVTREPGSPGATVRNHPSGGAERPVPNAIGVFARG